MNTYTDFELGWLAGLLDGEGYFLTRKGQPQVGCSMTDEDSIQKLQSIAGGRYCKQVYKKQENYKDTWIWYLHGRAAAELMLAIRDHMSERRRNRIDEIIAGYDQHKVDVSRSREAKKEIGLYAGRDYNSGKGSLRQLARQYGVSQVTVLNYSRFLRSDDWEGRAGTGGRPE